MTVKEKLDIGNAHLKRFGLEIDDLNYFWLTNFNRTWYYKGLLIVNTNGSYIKSKIKLLDYSILKLLTSIFDEIPLKELEHKIFGDRSHMLWLNSETLKQIKCMKYLD